MGAAILKVYTSGRMRSGEKTLSQEQLNAFCDEAKKLGLRTHVHAYRDAVYLRRGGSAADVGCFVGLLDSSTASDAD